MTGRHGVIASTALGVVVLLSAYGAAARTQTGQAVTKAVAPANTSAPTVAGTPKEGQVLSSATGAWTGTAPIAYAYQWQRCAVGSPLVNGSFDSDTSGWAAENGATISAATSPTHTGAGALQVVTTGSSAQGTVYRFAAGQIQAGHSYRFRVWVDPTATATINTIIRFYNSAGVELPDGGYPYVTAPGWSLLGIRLTAPTGATSGVVEVNVDRGATTFFVDDAVLTDCSAISGATTATYTVQAADAGSTLASLVSASNAGGSASAMSDVTAMALDKFDTAPAYTGPVFTDNTAAAAGDPPAPPPVTTTLPTWRNVYDWPNGHGYVGWHYATSATDGRYGADTNHGGNSGLWIWPVGGQQYTPNYAEWTYTAPGTTRISTVNLTYAYRNKLLAHHCIEVGLRTLDGTIVTEDTWCKPALPPDSQRDVHVLLEDPANNPTSKVLFFRVEMPACSNPSSPSCSKYIPSLDPLTTGAFARLELADLILVDDDNPIIQPSGPLWDIRDHFIDGTRAYPVTLGSLELGSGIVTSSFSHASTYPPATDSLGTQNAPCDPLHNTPPLDNRICPATFSWSTTVPTPPYPEGPNAFTETATDNAGNLGSQSWTIYIDRTAPSQVIPSGDLWDLNGSYIDGTQTYGLNIQALDPGREQQKASGISRVWLTSESGAEIASSSAPCTDLICPDDYTGSLSVDTSTLSEGAHSLTVHAVDLVGHVTDGPTITIYVDRTGPSAATDISVWSYDSGQATIGWTPGDDPDLPDGTAGSGFAGFTYRYQVNGGAWSEWVTPDSSDGATPSFSLAASAGDVVNVEVRESDAVGNQSGVASATLTITGNEHVAGLEPGSVAPDFANDPSPYVPDPNEPLQPPIVSDGFDAETNNVPDDDGLTPLDDGFSFAALPLIYAAAPTSTPHNDTAVSGAHATTTASFDTSGPCQLGPESAIGSGSKGGVGWTEYPSCIVFTNSVGSWTIYKVCKDQPAPGLASRRGVGPGYIATVVTSDGTRVVDDFQNRTSTVDAAIGNPGNLGAAHGGLGTFEAQYVRGQPGSTVGGRSAAGGATNVVDPATNATFPLHGTGDRPTWGMLNGRMCFDSQQEGVYDVTTYKPAPAAGATHSVDYEIDVWMRERSDVATGYGPLPGSSSQHPGDTHALFEVTYYYRFFPSEADSAVVVRTFRADVNGNVPMVKEPKIAAEINAPGRFSEIDILRPDKTVANTVTRGQAEAPNAVLYTRQSPDPSRAVARWGVGGSTQAARCSSGCFSVSMRSLGIAHTLPPSKDPFTQVADPFADYTRPPWQNTGSNAYGLDGWAVRSASRARAYPRDTTSDDVVTTCSADYQTNVLNAAGQIVHHKGDPILLKQYFHHSPPFTDSGRSRVSTYARVNMPDARRWEIGGWKPNATGGGDHPGDAYSRSFVLFNGWEGARGPNDCEPLETAFGAGVESYGVIGRYTMGSAFALFGSLPSK